MKILIPNKVSDKQSVALLWAPACAEAKDILFAKASA
jgi:hypothetical protein